jgi:hypothetical protein
MTDGIFLSVASVAAILVAVLVLAVLSSLVYLRTTGEVSERRSLVLFWGGLAVTWLLTVAVLAAVAMLST